MAKLAPHLIDLLVSKGRLYGNKLVPTCAKLLRDEGGVEEYPELWSDISDSLADARIQQEAFWNRRIIVRNQIGKILNCRDWLKHYEADDLLANLHLFNEEQQQTIKSDIELKFSKAIKREKATLKIEARNVRERVQSKDPFAFRSLLESLENLGVEGKLAALCLTAHRSYIIEQIGKRKSDLFEKLCKLLDSSSLNWGWGKARIGFKWILYIDLPVGQVCFSTSDMIGDQFYDGTNREGPLENENRVVAFAESIFRRNMQEPV